MGIVVKQFDGVSVTPKDDAVVRDLLFSEYGIFRGCGISFLGVNQIRVASGYMIVKGREVAITEETIAAQLSSNGIKRGRLYIHFDFSNQTTPAQFLTQVADELPALTQEEDANYNDGIFEIELCNYDVSEVAVSNIVESCPIITGGMDLLSTIEEVMANTMPGKGVDALVVGEVIDSLGGITQFVVDETTGKISGYKTEIGGADTVFPFKSGIYENLLDSFWVGNLNTLNATYTATEDAEILLEILIVAGGTSQSATKANANIEITPTTAISETYDEIVDTKNGSWQKYTIKRYKLNVSIGDVITIKATQTSTYSYTSVTALLWG